MRRASRNDSWRSRSENGERRKQRNLRVTVAVAF
jgi:hypothetical protein